MSRAGFVLCGGRSSRMGADKALLPYRGRPLVDYVASQVRQAAGSVTLLGPPERYACLGYPILADREADGGPLAGVLSALEAGLADWNLVVACDMPNVEGAWLARLLDAAEAAQADCLLPVGPSSRPEPTCAVYHARCLASLRAAFAAGARKVTQALAGLRLQAWPVDDPQQIQNLNTPEEWAAVRP